MNRPTLYLSGPMSGLPEFNHPAFKAAAAKLRAAGYQVVCPTENGLPPDAPWDQHMRADIAAMVAQCNAIALLPGCQDSKGARLELDIAVGLNFRASTVEGWLESARLIAEAESLMEA